MNPPIWQRALEAQLSGLRLLRMMESILPHDHRTYHSFVYDHIALRAAEPCGWSQEATSAVLAASSKVPSDASLIKQNLPTVATWWYFEEPIHIETTNDLPMVRAFLISWAKSHGQYGLGCSVWCDDPRQGLIPSQTLFWPEGLPLEEALSYIRSSYLDQYGKGGPLESKVSLGVERYMIASEQIARFMLAATAWIGTVLPHHQEPVHRALRKEAQKTLGHHDPRGVKVFHLRRREHLQQEGGTSSVLYSHRWLVEGHFRQQPCGPHLSQRKLIWIDAYVKGPDDKPFVEKKRIVVVNR